MSSGIIHTTAHIVRSARSIAAGVVDLCYPGRCEACERGTGDEREPLCASCSNELHKLETASCCARCAMPLVELDDPCPYCHDKGVPNYERIVRLGVFNDPIKHLIHRMKYHGRWPIAEYFADRLIAQERVKAVLHETDVIVPIPLHPWRHITRGYNQADVVARRIARTSDVALSRSLVRLRNTQTQIHLHSVAKRGENLRGAFALVDARSVQGKHVLVIDDVLTTGATLGAAARELARGKPASICALTIAIADPKRRDFQAI